MVSNKKPFSCFPVVIIQYPLKSSISLVVIPSSWLARNGKASYSLPAVYFWEKFNPRRLKRELSAHVCKIKSTPAQTTSECAAIWKQEISAEFSCKKWRISRDVLYVAWLVAPPTCCYMIPAPQLLFSGSSSFSFKISLVRHVFLWCQLGRRGTICHFLHTSHICTVSHF